MNEGDILILMTDGFEEHLMNRGGYTKHMEQVLRTYKDTSAKEIGDAIFYDALHNHNWSQKDDMTLVVVKKTA
jgi:serine phosphatase RsbU (regulator of sigma subunit)